MYGFLTLMKNYKTMTAFGLFLEWYSKLGPNNLHTILKHIGGFSLDGFENFSFFKQAKRTEQSMIGISYKNSSKHMKLRESVKGVFLECELRSTKE